MLLLFTVLLLVLLLDATGATTARYENDSFFMGIVVDVSLCLIDEDAGKKE